MIYNAEWRDQFIRLVMPRIAAAHPDLTRIAAALRDGVGVDVWTEAPSDTEKLTAGRTHYSLEGWRTHYRGEAQRLTQWIGANRALLQGYDAQAIVAIDGYLASMAALGPAFAAVIANYTDAQGRVLQQRITQADRDTLAAAIEAELQ